jgi:hypothetical protein
VEGSYRWVGEFTVLIAAINCSYEQTGRARSSSQTRTLGKDLTGRYPVPQVVWARYFFQFALMLLLIPRVGFMDLVRTARLGTHVMRGLLLAASTICLIGAISFVPLADPIRSRSRRRCWSPCSRSRCSASASAGGAGAPCSRASPAC